MADAGTQKTVAGAGDSVSPRAQDDRTELPGGTLLRLLGSAVRDAKDAILITEAQPVQAPGPRIVWVNPAFEATTGYARAEAIGRTPRFLQGPQTDPEATRRMRSALEAGRAVDVELVNYRKDGTPFDAHVSILPVVDEDGRLSHWAAIVRDVTRQKRVEQELRDTLARYRAILSSALDPIVTIDVRGVIQGASDSIERVFGWRPEELVGRNVSTLMPEPHHSAHDGYLANYRRTGQTNILGRTREFNAVRKDGAAFPIELSVSRVEVPGKNEPLFTGIISDISERKQAEEELALHRDHLEELVAERTAQLESSHEQLRQADRLASIGTLAAGLGHDMNNVLFPLRCRLDTLDLTTLAPEVRPHFDAVRRSAEYLQQLADGLHLLALDPNDTEASSESTDLAQWWGHFGSLLARGLPKHVKLSATLPRDLPPVAVAPHRLTQAMLNLMVNAGEAVGRNGEVRVWAEVMQDRRFVRLGVSDNGCGMTADVKRQALDPFFTTKTRGLGTGLGLPLVLGVARTAGGSVHIDSAPGKGTAVVLNLPAAQPPASRESHDSPTAVVSIGDRRTAGFLLSLLESAGFAVRQWSGPEPGPCRLWLTEPLPAALPAARRLAATPGCHIVVLGEPSQEWAALGAAIIHDPNDFEAVRQMISNLAGATS